MSSKEYCHGCGKPWIEESPDCVFNYHKKPETIKEDEMIDLECSLCLKKIWEYEGFNKTMRYGYVKYFHDNCAIKLVQEQLDKMQKTKEDEGKTI